MFRPLDLGAPGFGDSCSKRQNGPVEFTVPSVISAGFSASAPHGEKGSAGIEFFNTGFAGFEKASL